MLKIGIRQSHRQLCQHTSQAQPPGIMPTVLQRVTPLTSRFGHRSFGNLSRNLLTAIEHRWRQSRVTTVNLSQDLALEVGHRSTPEVPRDLLLQ